MLLALLKLGMGQNCTRGQFCTKTNLHKGTKFYENKKTIVHKGLTGVKNKKNKKL